MNGLTGGRVSVLCEGRNIRTAHLFKAVICTRSLPGKRLCSVLQPQKLFWSAAGSNNLTVIVSGEVANLILHTGRKRDLTCSLGTTSIFGDAFQPVINEDRFS